MLCAFHFFLYLCTMIAFPQAKINLGLNVVSRRPDGYHNLETVFYPVPLCDVLEVQPMDSAFPCDTGCDLKVTGLCIEGDEQQNLVARAYHMLKAERSQMGRFHIHLHKVIPSQAGMGGGSSDGATMMLLLNEMCALGFTQDELKERAARLGADCAFFIMGRPAYAEGIGDRLTPIDLSLKGWYLAVVRPNVAVSTKEAYSLVTPAAPRMNCRDIVTQLPVGQWRDVLVNDFEKSVIALHPVIGQVKEQLYALGAEYSAMSGSGSAVFGLFRHAVDVSEHFPGMFTALMTL